MPKIDLEGLAPSKETPEQVASARRTVQVDLMLEAIESPRGLAFDFESARDAMSARIRFYAARRREQKRGNHSLDDLLFRIEGTTLMIVHPPSLIARRL